MNSNNLLSPLSSSVSSVIEERTVPVKQLSIGSIPQSNPK